jgi:putative membrane protein
VSAPTLPAIASALAVLAGGALLLLFHDLGPLSAHMVLHVFLMSAVAPLAASLLGSILFGFRNTTVRPGVLYAFAVAQIALLWAWHAPALQRQMHTDPDLGLLMHGSLLVVAFGFWAALIHLGASGRGQIIAVLLVTAKLSCLPAVLLIFAPRLLYELPAHGHAAHATWALTGIEDQQLAGLIMVSACPLSYILAGIVVAAQMLHGLAAAPLRRDPTSALG